MYLTLYEAIIFRKKIVRSESLWFLRKIEEIGNFSTQNGLRLETIKKRGFYLLLAKSGRKSRLYFAEKGKNFKFFDEFFITSVL